MNVASLELSKQLFEVSKEKLGIAWYADQSWYTNSEGTHIIKVTIPADRCFICPAYDIGFILRKLPARIQRNDVWYGLEAHFGRGYDGTDEVRNAWFAYENKLYFNGTENSRLDIQNDGRTFPNRVFGDDDDTPENAACKLAIALFQQGILKRKGEK